MSQIYEDFQTTDIILAASLRAHDYEMKSVEKDGNKGVFVFENVDQEFITTYDLGKVRVEPVTFNNFIKQLTTSARRLLS